eukprot:TRINITY_DN8427_c0_g1_i1.p1 TRINITY_DN8427_c0_g1~~TRINITY_DN8427_c0_g1_i1.p1  ORF type:complete len:552 (-),score=182.85 TRINITY_DN8427_c0_g1_i1:65-1720(-)
MSKKDKKSHRKDKKHKKHKKRDKDKTRSKSHSKKRNKSKSNKDTDANDSGKMKLFDDDNFDVKFAINKNYAKQFERVKTDEEISKLRDMISESEESSEDSDSQIEDDNGVLVEDHAENFIKTLAELSKPNSKVLKEKKHLFEEYEYEDVDLETEKPMHYKDLVREEILEKVHKKEKAKEKKDSSLSIAQDRALAEKNLISAVAQIDDSDSEELLVKREKPRHTEKDYLSLIDAQDNDVKEFWLNDENKSEADKYLFDYIIHKKWEDKEDELPTYEELLEYQYDEEDDEYIQKQELHEFTYNFRHQEPDGAKIETYSRDQPFSARKNLSKRAKQRQRQKDNRDKKRQAKEEKKKKLMNLKKKQIMNRLQEIAEISGISQETLENIDLDQDFTPEQHEKLMNEVFDDDYYEQEDENEEFLEPEKPKIGPDYWDYENMNTGPIEKVIKNYKEVYGDSVNTDEFNKYLEEYYKTDFEDVVGDTPVRFKYTKVKPFNYGMDIPTILETDHQDLNAHASLKLFAPYRTDHGIPNKYRRKRKRSDRSSSKNPSKRRKH